MLLYRLWWITVPAYGVTALLVIPIPCSPFRSALSELIMHAPWDAPSLALLSKLNILLFQEWLAKLKAKIVFKALNRLLPSCIAEKFLRFSAVHVRETRNSKRNLKLPRIKQSFGQRSFMFSTASLWRQRSWKAALPWGLLKTNLSELKFVNCMNNP